MSNQKFRAVVLKKEAPYNLDQSLADDFATMDICVGPSSGKLNGEYSEVAGVVEDCWYNRDIIAEIEVFDDEIAEKLSEGMLAVCPTVAKQFDGDEEVEGINLFVTAHPDEEVVGEAEAI